MENYSQRVAILGAQIEDQSRSLRGGFSGKWNHAS